MRLVRFYLRYFPPAIILEYKLTSGASHMTTIDLSRLLSSDTIAERVADELIRTERLLSRSRKKQLVKLLSRLVEKQKSPRERLFSASVLRPHSIALTNIASNKNGTKVASVSYDQTCKLYDLSNLSGCKDTNGVQLRGHTNIVYCVAFNNPFGDLISTGSFDKTVRLWSSASGRLVHTLEGHEAEVVGVVFSPDAKKLASISVDMTVRLWDCVAGRLLHVLRGHTREVSCVSFSASSDLLVSGGCDATARIWDACSGRNLLTLSGHISELSCVAFAPATAIAHKAAADASAVAPIAAVHHLVLTAGADGRALIWDVGPATSASPAASTPPPELEWVSAPAAPLDLSTQPFCAPAVLSADNAPFGGCENDFGGGSGGGCGGGGEATAGETEAAEGPGGFEVTDVSFDAAGARLAVATSNGFVHLFARVPVRYTAWVKTALLGGHGASVSRVIFSARGDRLVSASATGMVRLWDVAAASCEQIIRDHRSDVFGLCLSYDGGQLVTASKDNTLRVWRPRDSV